MIEIRFNHPDDGQRVVFGTSKETGSFTVGRSSDCSLVLTPAELSRCALTVEEADDDQVRITGGQRYGYVQVTRADGVRKATLAAGEEVVCGDGTYRLVLRTSAADVLSLDVRVTARRRNDLPAYRRSECGVGGQIFRPTPTTTSAGSQPWLLSSHTPLRDKRARTSPWWLELGIGATGPRACRAGSTRSVNVLA